MNLRFASCRPFSAALPLIAAAYLLLAAPFFGVRAQDDENPYKPSAAPRGGNGGNPNPRPIIQPERGRVVRAPETPAANDAPRNPAVERTIAAVCYERENDPLASTPIDVMQAKANMYLGHPAVVAGIQRAERLLPIAKQLAVEAIYLLGKKYKVDPVALENAARRVNAVNKVEPDVDLRDNAAVVLNRPTVINFGTIFLAGLPSDEAMISVLAHELTHLADGKADDLQVMFRAVGRRAVELTGLRITGRRPEELSCDWVGVLAAGLLIERTRNTEPMSRRLARAVAHNCVASDETDEAHLSPRDTMRAIFALDNEFARGVRGELADLVYPSPALFRE